MSEEVKGVFVRLPLSDEQRELKSCPFCGGHRFEILAPYHAFVHCAGCRADGPLKDTKEDAITAWNARAGEKA